MLCPLLLLGVLAELTVSENSELEKIARFEHSAVPTNFTSSLLTSNYLENKFPFLKSNCVKEALKQFLPICLKEGIESVDAELRVETAVKLSICEFEASGLEHIPKSCSSKDVESMMDCMIQLESSAQWWTTYSGNYQRLPTICYENSLPYEKEQTLALFLNVTNMYNDISKRLNKQLYDIVSSSEYTSTKHMEKMASMFQHYMSRFAEESKSHESVIESEFEEHRSYVNELIVKNSDVLEKELTKLDFELMSKAKAVLDTIEMIKDSLQDSDIAEEIDQMNQRALNKWKAAEEMAGDALKKQHDGQAQLNEEWESLVSSTKSNISIMSTELVKSQNHAVEILNSYGDMMRHYVISTFSEDMFPELQELHQQLLRDWKDTTNCVAEDLAYWNKEFSESFESISQNLNRTIETVSDLDQRVSKIQELFVKLQRGLGLIWKVCQYNLTIVRYMLGNRVVWALMLMTVCRRKLFRALPSKRLAWISLRYIQVAFKWSLLLLLIVIGSTLGTTIVPK